MTTEKKETPSQQFMPRLYPQYYGPDEEEISLFELWQVLVKRWWLILIVSFLSVVLAVAYALLLPKTYQAEVQFSPPLEKELQGMQPGDVFSQFQGNLKSRASLKEFFEAEKLIEVLAPERSSKTSGQSLFVVFQALFSFNANKAVVLDWPDQEQVAVVLDWPDQEQVAVLLNRYIEMVAVQTKVDVINDVKDGLLRNKITLEQSIVSERKMASARRADEIEILKEALAIAKVLEIEDYAGAPVVGNMRTSSTFNFGSKALSAQIAALEKRKSDDPYITGIRGLEHQIRMIDTQLLSLSNDFDVVRVNQKAYRPDSPVNVNKRKIVVKSAVLGLVLGVFAAFFFNFLENNRKEQKSKA